MKDAGSGARSAQRDRGFGVKRIAGEADSKAAKRQGSSVSQFVREAALMRARMATDDNPYPMRALAEQLRAIGDQGYELAEKALKVAEEEAERKR